jgi:hypothetical protein
LRFFDFLASTSSANFTGGLSNALLPLASSPIGRFSAVSTCKHILALLKNKNKKINSWEIGRIIIIQVTLIKIRKGTSLPVAKL